MRNPLRNPLRNQVRKMTCRYIAVVLLLFCVAACADEGQHEEEEVDLGCMRGWEPNEENTSCVRIEEGEDPREEQNGGSQFTPLPPPSSPFLMQDQQLRARVGNDGEGRLWLLEGVSERERLVVLIDELFGGPTEPGVYAITAEETAYDTCGLCVLLQAGCHRLGSELLCEYEFMPRAQGEVELEVLGTAPGEPMVGELRGLVLQEVVIGPDFQTTPVVGGIELELMPWRFEAVIEDAQEPPPQQVCGGHGHLHGNHCHCDPGYRLDPTNPLNCIEA